MRDERRVFLHEILAPILLRDDGGRRVYGDPERVDHGRVVRDARADPRRRREAVSELLPEFADDLAAYQRRGRRAACGDRRRLRRARNSAAVARRRDRARDSRGASRRCGGPLARQARAIGLAYGASAGRLPGRPTSRSSTQAATAAALSSTLGSGSGVFRGGCQLNNMLGELDVIGASAAASRRAAAEHDDADARARRRPAAAGARKRRARCGSPARSRRSLARARAAGRWPRRSTRRGSTSRSRLLHLEGGWARTRRSRLERRWDVVRWSGRNLFFGGVAAVERRPDGTLAAAGDPRRGGHGVVV